MVNYLQENEIPLTNILSCATDGAAAMVGRYKGFIGLLKSALPGVYTIHCMVHRQNLIAKKLAGRLNVSLNTVINSVNYIRAHALKDRLFQLLCIENEEDNERLVLHTKVRWLSKGDCLKRFVDLFDSIIEFMEEEGHPLKSEILQSKCDIFYLSGIFEKLNVVNKQLQGRDANLITCKDAVTSFIKKLDLLSFYMKRRELRHFPTLDKVANIIKDEDFDVLMPSTKVEQ